MIELIGIEERLQLSYNISEKPANFLSHLFFVNDKFIISKFVSKFVEKHDISFDYRKFAEAQLGLLSNPSCLSDEKISVDTTGLSNEELLALINFRDVWSNYSILLGDTSLLEKDLNVFGNEEIIRKFINFKEDLIEDIVFLTPKLSWRSNNITFDENKEDIKTLDTLIKSFQKENTTTINIVYKPTRPIIRFFLYHFFGFAIFSEERQNTVNLGTISEPEKYINKEVYKNNGAVMIEGGQYDIIASILQNQNTLGLLSTGGGKSITFLLSGMLKPGVCFVVAPLKSLIDDQYTNIEDKFNLYGLAGKIHGGMEDKEKEVATQNLLLGKYKFFYCAPERLQIQKFVKDVCEKGLQNNGFVINQIVIDEAHCLSERGHDFRHSYLNIQLFKDYIKEKNIQKIPIIGLTATASQIVKNDIISYLEITHIIEESTLNRPNLSLEIKLVEDPTQKPQIIKGLLDENINATLGHVANLQSKIISPITMNTTGKGYINAGIVFTMYGKKTSKFGIKAEASVSQSAEGILDFLKQEYRDSNYAKMFFSESPGFGEIQTCPKCSGLDILKYKIDQILCKNNIYQKYEIFSKKQYKYFEKYDREKLKFCKNIEVKTDGWVCNNSSCLWISEKEIDPDYQKPNKKTNDEVKNSNDKKEVKDARERIKSQAQKDFKDNKTGLLIATKGFGMGIDKSNIRYIIHATLSSSLESYYQEIGRAGRDKEHSHCILLFSGPNEECIQETKNLEKTLPCVQDLDSIQYGKCPKGLSTTCDIARQQQMMMKPVIISIGRGKNKKGEFLDKYLEKKDFIDAIETYQIKNVLKEKGRIQDQTVKSLLLEKIGSNFTHSLVEFWQLYFFYNKFVIGANKGIENEIIIQSYNQGDDNEQDESGFEKMIYRLMCLGLFTHYFKEYQGNNHIIFHIFTRNNKPKEILSKYLIEKLNIPEKDHISAFNSDEYPIFKERLSKQEEIVKLFWMLIYFMYDKVATQRKEMLRNLYESIKESEPQEGVESKCFRQGIINRLSGLKKSNTKKCGFCSGCVNDTSLFKESLGTLDRDEEIQEINHLMEKKLRGIELTEKEEEKIKKYESDLFTESRIKILFNNIEKGGFAIMDQLVNLSQKYNYNTIPSIQKAIESGTYSPRYYLLSAYYEPNYRRERVERVFELLYSANDSEGLYNLGKWIGINTGKDANKKDIFEIIDHQQYQESLFSYFQTGILVSHGNISEKDLEKCLVISKAYKSFTFNNK